MCIYFAYNPTLRAQSPCALSPLNCACCSPAPDPRSSLADTHTPPSCRKPFVTHSLAPRASPQLGLLLPAAPAPVPRTLPWLHPLLPYRLQHTSCRVQLSTSLHADTDISVPPCNKAPTPSSQPIPNDHVLVAPLASRPSIPAPRTFVPRRSAPRLAPPLPALRPRPPPAAVPKRSPHPLLGLGPKAPRAAPSASLHAAAPARTSEPAAHSAPLPAHPSARSSPSGSATAQSPPRSPRGSPKPPHGAPRSAASRAPLRNPTHQSPPRPPARRASPRRRPAAAHPQPAGGALPPAPNSQTLGGRRPSPGGG